ncbi:hypothetical protein HPP92_005801 [Vanilla planifolia]|uniref:RFTS domain-containing protein n=1 Tax=Vanilla planifolia TaxID=51239 RepID=A0A835RKX7_VANPL|nr:hypothetical protein HPP92_005801 [Vanilla planifolia]
MEGKPREKKGRTGKQFRPRDFDVTFKMARKHGSTDSMVMKRKANGKCLLSNNQTKEFIDASDEAPREKENANITENGEQITVRKRPKRAASCSTFKEKNIRLSEKTSVIEVKESRTEEEEKDAVEITKLGAENLPPCRKLVDFVFHDADGKSQPFEVCEIDDIYITALIMPMDDSLEKEKERGVRCEGFGRIESWSISGYDEELQLFG